VVKRFNEEIVRPVFYTWQPTRRPVSLTLAKMIKDGDKRPGADFLFAYQHLVNYRYPAQAGSWPLLTGYDFIGGTFKGWTIAVFIDTGFMGGAGSQIRGVGELSESAVGEAEITPDNKETVRARLERHFDIKKRDAIVLYPPEGFVGTGPEIMGLILRHEWALNLSPMKIFLSHKGLDKPRVRPFKETLLLLGFSPWFDEDSMTAGTNLERGILRGFQESCAAVFFITPNFIDENYLATEVDYAIQQQRDKGDKFAIITLVFGDGTAKGKVPDLLRRYVWKEPNSDLEALREIIKALPIKVGDVRWC
jgi:hypothetical protein